MSESFGKADSLTLFKLMADEAIMGFVTFDLKSNECVYANNLARNLLELPNDFKPKDLNMDALFPNETNDHRMSQFNEEMLQNEGFFQYILMKKMNDMNFVANVGLKKIDLDGHPHLLLMIQDMTMQSKLQREIIEKQNAIKSAYEELLLQNDQLKQLDVAKNRFIALTTHELRTPTSAVYATAEVLKLKFYDTDEEHDEFIETIYEQAGHLLELINDILDFAKISANKMDYYVEQKNVVEIVDHQIEALETYADTSKVDLTFEKPDMEILCYFDSLRLKQVVNNIVNNAIKYNVDKGKVRVWFEQDEDFVKLLVEDTGKGIPEEQQDSVFNEFETLGQVATHSKGTGLGMPISRRLIESQGGIIDLTSEVGVGSKFWITIPKKKVLTEENYRSRPNLDSGDLAA